MSKNLFTDEDIKKLSTNKYVRTVSPKAITYTDEFKRILIAEHNNGKSTRKIFEECGFDVDALGMIRVKAAGKRWRKTFRKDGVLGLDDARKINNRKAQPQNLSLKEQNSRLEAQIKLLKAENELLKKIEIAERGLMGKK